MIGAATLTFDAGSLTVDRPPTGKTSPAPRSEPSATASVELLARARGGDAEALNDLCARYLPRLQKWAHGRLPLSARGALDTHDLVQDTLAHVASRIGSFEPRHDGAFQAYLRAALLNRIRDQLRSVKRRPTDALECDRETDDPGPLEQAIGAEALERYEAALLRLRPDDREAIILRIELGLAYPDIAHSLGKPTVGAAHAAVSRALVRLAKEMSIERRSRRS